MKTSIMKTALLAVVLPAVCGCLHEEYDISRGIEKEVTLFTEEVSLPLGNIGPITPKTLIEKAGIGDVLKSFVQEDSESYLVVEQSGEVYKNWVMMLSMTNPANATSPIDVPVSAFSGKPGSSMTGVQGLGLSLSPQVFTLIAENPLTEDIALSGKLNMSTAALGDQPAKTLVSKEFSKTKIAAGATRAEVIREAVTDGQSVGSFGLDGLTLHLPASIMTKDPKNGLGAFSLDYNFKGYLSIVTDFPAGIPFDVNDLNLPLGQYRVKEAKIMADVSNEIPITLVVEKINVLVKEGDKSPAPLETVTVTPDITIKSGSTGKPVTTPLEIVIKATEGTLPDISGLRLSLLIKAPTGDGDKRLGMNQNVYVKNLRATVSGGITIKGL